MNNSNHATVPAGAATIQPESLGSSDFCRDYNIKYAYLSGGMYKGIASKEIVIAMGKAGLMGFLGTGGLKLEIVEDAILTIKSALNQGQSYGMNLLSNLEHPEHEEKTVDLYLKHGVKFIEAAAYMQITPSLVRYRLHGVKRGADGNIDIPNKVMAKISRPEVAEVFMRPAPARIVNKLLEQGKITQEQADLSKHIPVAHEICVQADSGGHTYQGIAYVLMPAIRTQRDRIMAEEKYSKAIKVGAAGGIGTPEAAAAAFMLGAEFILTGSINQCTVEAGISDKVKEMLEDINVQDTAYAPAGDMFELGAKVQVLKKGLFFATRGNKLYDLYMRYNSLDEIDERTRKQIQEKFFKRSFEEVWAETAAYLDREQPGKRAAIEKSPKQKMAMIFKWYFVHTTRLAMKGSEDQQVDYQVHCGPALGAFNQWVKGTQLEKWQNRHVDQIGMKIMQDTATLMGQRFEAIR